MTRNHHSRLALKFGVAVLAVAATALVRPSLDTPEPEFIDPCIGKFGVVAKSRGKHPSDYEKGVTEFLGADGKTCHFIVRAKKAGQKEEFTAQLGLPPLHIAAPY